MSDCGRSEAVAEAPECVVSRAISLTRLLNLLGRSRAIFLCFPLRWTCARCHSQTGFCVWDAQMRDSPANAAADAPLLTSSSAWCSMASGCIPPDNHRKSHPSPICSCQRGFTKTGRAHPCLDLWHWAMPHHNVFIYRILHVWPSSSILIPRVLVAFYILYVQMHTLNNV